MADPQTRVWRRTRRGAAGGHRPGAQIIAFGPAFARQADQHLGGLGGVDQRLAGEPLEEVLGQQHGVDVVADDHAGALVVGELRVEG
ncbi:hypothetical protein G6F32_017286 [Rhizopus arrhizus]|nr:hypothetical protein G6F32_017286 [Rhizopus arrhizus]